MIATEHRRIVLVGFMGAGKTSVGRRLAARLEWSFIDLDAEIERRTGRSIEAWFAHSGEAAFRGAEADVADAVLRRSGVVVASGGGWAARPGSLEGVATDTASVWLDVDAEEAWRRVQADEQLRPLLAVGDGLERVRELLADRRSAYGRAKYRVDTNGHSVEDVTSRILEILETQGTRTEAE